MTATTDAAGNFHNTIDGRFTGHAKAEAGPIALHSTTPAFAARDWSGLSTDDRYEAEVVDVLAAAAASGWQPVKLVTEEGGIEPDNPQDLAGYARSAEMATIWFRNGEQLAHVEFGRGQDIGCHRLLEAIVAGVLGEQ